MMKVRWVYQYFVLFTKNAFYKCKTLFSLFPSLMIQRFCDSNAVKPGRKFGFAFKRTDGLVYLHKNFLRNIFRIFGILHYAQRRVEDHILPGVNNGFESGFIPLLQ